MVSDPFRSRPMPADRAENYDTFMLASHSSKFEPRSETDWWLAVSQRVLTNANGMISRGQSEAAMKLIAAYWEKWRNAI